MSETMTIPASENIFPNTDGSDSAPRLLAKVIDALREFKRENVFSLSTVCEVCCSGFPLADIKSVAAELKADGYYVQIQRCYWEKGLYDPSDRDGWSLYLRISAKPFPAVRPLRWWQQMFYYLVRPVTYIPC